MSELPPGWEWTTIGDVTVPVSKIDPRIEPDLEFDYIDIGGVDGDRGAIVETQRLTGSEAPSRARQLVRVGDTVLSTVRTYMRKTAPVPLGLDGQVASTGFSVLRPAEGVHPMYLYHAVRRHEFVDTLSSLQTGSSYPAVREKDVRSMPLPLAPRAEQERIAAALEEHLSRLDSAGTLVRSVIPRLGSMRRASIKSLIEPGWPRRPLGVVTTNFDGRRVPVKRADRATRAGPFPYYGASGVIDSVDGFLFDGDFLLIAEDGANLATRSKPIAFAASGQFWVNNHAHVVQPVGGVDLKYLELVINEADIQHWITGSAQPKLTQANLNRIDVLIPTLPEQLNLVAEHERTESILAMHRQVLESVEKRGESLRRSVLAAAFSGHLIPQDNDDEPAAMLLERIRSESAARSTMSKRKAKEP